MTDSGSTSNSGDGTAKEKRKSTTKATSESKSKSKAKPKRVVFLSTKHHHALRQTMNPGDRRVCNVCKHKPDRVAFYCSPCDFNLCGTCYTESKLPSAERKSEPATEGDGITDDDDDDDDDGGGGGGGEGDGKTNDGDGDIASRMNAIEKQFSKMVSLLQPNVGNLPLPASIPTRERGETGPLEVLLRRLGGSGPHKLQQPRGGDGNGGEDDGDDDPLDDGGDGDDNDPDYSDPDERSHRGKRDRKTKPGGSQERIAPHVLRETLRTHRTFTAWCRNVDWRSSRNRHEVSSLCAVLDALLAEEAIPLIEKSVGIEVLVRRLVGVHHVDQGSDWAVAKALEWDTPGTMVPRSVLKSALREAALAAKFDKPYRASTSKPYGTTSSVSGGGRSFGNKSYKGSRRGGQRGKSGGGGSGGSNNQQQRSGPAPAKKAGGGSSAAPAQ